LNIQNWSAVQNFLPLNPDAENLLKKYNHHKNNITSRRTASELLRSNILTSSTKEWLLFIVCLYGRHDLKCFMYIFYLNNKSRR
jgi:hypothetical protein